MSPTIFVVDDDPSVRKSLTRMITLAGHAAEAFASAQHFLGHEPFVRPSCAVLDVRMPGLTGLDVQKTFARSGRAIPIIFLTKPFDIERLRFAIERALVKDVKDLSEEGRIGDVRARVERITRRETTVCALVAELVRLADLAGN
jgi:FixJ family two-component response regulator